MRQNKEIKINYFLTKSHLIQIGGFFVFSFLLLILPLCGQTQNKTEPEEGDAIVWGALADARTLTPILASDTSSAEICSLIFNGLLKYDKNINLIGDLAESWDIKNDGLTIIFHLRKDVLWHDGKKFTAQDVKFTYDMLRDPKIKTPYSGDFLKVRELKILDDYTIEVNYDEPFSPGLSSWSMWIMPRHILENQDLNTSDFSQRPVGTGPYKFGRWKKQEKIELFANPAYFEGKPPISRYIYRIIPDQATLFLELQTKNIDIAGLSALQFTRQTNNDFFNKYYKKYKTPSFGYTYLGYNLEDDKFKNKKVRQALNLAVDKNEIIKIVLLGEGSVLTGPFLPQSWAYNEKIEDAGFHPEKARQLLQGAGWSDSNKDGYLDKDGRIFEFTILTNQGNDARIRCAEIIQKQLKNIGIKVKIKVLEWSSLLNEFINHGRFEAVLLGWSLSRDPDCYDIWHSSKTKEGEFNFIHYKNADVDKLLDQARRSFDTNQRRQYYHRIHELIYNDQPTMFLYAPNSLDIVSARFRGIEPAPIGIGYNLHKWWVTKNEQKYQTKVEVNP